MSQTGLDHDGQRELEQRALRNVRRLAESLGYRDAMDRRKEKRLAIAMVAIAAVLITWLTLATITAETPESEMNRRRCEVGVRAENTVEIKSRIFKEHPELNAKQRDELAEKTVKDMAAAQCSVPSK
jgi:hypothetical protein